MPEPTRFTVYADFNCPFCYALDERIEALGLAERVAWRPVQHAPTIGSSLCTFDALHELTAETSEVRRRSPSTEISVPPYRPNSGLASGLLCEAMVVDPVRGRELRRLVYRALWVRGLDISMPEVLAPLQQQVGLASLAVSEETTARLARWQQAWEQGDFERSIPVILGDDGTRIVGFPAQRELDAYLLADGGVSAYESLGVCAMKPRQKLLVIDDDARFVQTVIAQMKGYDIALLARTESLLDVLAGDAAPDLVLLDRATVGEGALDTVRELKGLAGLRGIPVVVISDRRDEAEEVAAFVAGAADYLHKPCPAAVLKARLTTHLDMKHSKDLLASMARFDSLTETYNRREFDIRLQSEWVRGTRDRSPLSLLMIDIDLFKQYNDYYGHGLGDDCLRAVARALRGCIRRPGDLLARYGGEEFCVLLVDTAGEGAFEVAETCRQRVADAQLPHVVSTIAEHVTVSVGVATEFPDRSGQPGKLLERADRALYVAKRGGRNRVAVYQPAEPNRQEMSITSTATRR